jgi:hypothetical protein
MAQPASSLVAICPDCGGILQPVALEQLTSLEVASSEAPAAWRRVQCLLCGYETDQRVEAAGETAFPA